MVATGLWDSVSAGVYGQCDELGIEVVDADPALETTFRDAAKPITAAWTAKAKTAGIDADAALAFYKQRLADLNK
jgi:hypothetical protein